MNVVPVQDVRNPIKPAPAPITEPLPTPAIPALLEEITDAKVLEAQRIEANNQKLIRGISEFNRLIDTLDLDFKDISPENLAACYDLLRKLGRQLFNHPDIVRIVQEYPQLLQEMSRLRSAMIQKEQADITAETRTKI